MGNPALFHAPLRVNLQARTRTGIITLGSSGTVTQDPVLGYRAQPSSYLTFDPTGFVVLARGCLALHYQRVVDAGADQLIFFHNNVAADSRVYLFSTTGDQFAGRVGSNSPGPVGAVVNGTMYAPAIEWDGANSITRELKSDVAGTPTTYTGMTGVLNPVVVGANGGFTASADGWVSDVMLFERPLTFSERKVLAGATSWSFDILDDSMPINLM